MEANIEIMPQRKVEMAVIMRGQEDSANTVWFVGLVTLVLLVIGGAGMNRACKLIRRRSTGFWYKLKMRRKTTRR
jgi:hypothetical protein